MQWAHTPFALLIGAICVGCVCAAEPGPAAVPGDLGISLEDVAIFQITLWSSLFLLITTCFAACSLSYMDTGDDSIFNIDISSGVKKAN